MAKKRSKKTKKVINIISIIVGIIYFISFITFNYMILYLNVLPTKYLIPYLAIMILLFIVFIVFFFVKKIKSGIKIFSVLIGIIFSLIFGFGSFYISKTYDFMDKIGSKNMTIEEYYVVVNNDSEYKKITDLKGKKIGIYDEKIEIFDKALEELKTAVSAKTEKIESIDLMTKVLIEDNLDAILISSAHKSVVDENSSIFKETTKIIHTIQIEVKNEDAVKHSNINISNDVFTVYISGMDSYGNISARSRSDVNMLATINPKTHEVLLTSIPRDYYVQLHGTTGTKDKLTHSGFYGVNSSKATIEDLLDIKIDYYVKANFSAVQGIVDVIGGVDVYSDASFYTGADPTIFIRQGTNHMDGRTALAFARERHAYIDGDRHRVKNQQDVLMAVVKKLTSSTALLTKYSELLDKLSNSFETDIQTKDITGLIKYQIDKMPSWVFKNYSLDGTDSENYTYSMGRDLLYVMEPNYDTVKTASKYINQMKKGKSFSKIGIE